MNDAPFSSLTEQEKACLRLVWQHLDTKEISRETDLAPSTVDTYLKRAALKLGVVGGRFPAARLFATYESRLSLREGPSPPEGLSSLPLLGRKDGQPFGERQVGQTARDVGISYDLTDATPLSDPPLPTSVAVSPWRINWRRVGISVVGTIVIALVVIAMAAVLTDVSRLLSSER